MYMVYPEGVNPQDRTETGDYQGLEGKGGKSDHLMSRGSVLWIYPFWIFHIHGTVQCVGFCVLLSLSTVFAGLIYTVPCISSSFFLKLILCHMDMPHFVYSFASSWTFGLLPPLGYCEWYCHDLRVCYWVPVFSSSGYIPRNGIDGSVNKEHLLPHQ